MAKIKNLDGYIGTADSLIKYDDKFRGVVLNQLGNVIVVDNLDTLNKVGKLINYKYKIVTLDGEVQYSGGAITGGTIKNNNGVLNQKYELANLKKELDNKKSNLNKLEQSLKEVNENLDSKANELEKNQREVILMTETVQAKSNHLKDLESNFKVKNNELVGTQNKSNNSLDKELDDLLKQYYDKVAMIDK